MLRLCSILAACGLLWSSAAGAATTTYALEAASRVDWETESLQYIPAATAVSGHFTIDDSVFEATPGAYTYPGAFSGTFRVGANTITVDGSRVQVYDYAPHFTELTMLSGAAFQTGGTIAETAPFDGLVLTHVQVKFIYPGRPSVDTPIEALLETATSNRMLTLGFRAADGSTVSAWWQIGAISPVPEPASATLFLTGSVLLGAVALRRRARGYAA